MRKAACQEKVSISQPPKAGATAIEMPVETDQSPIASPCRSRGKLAETIARLPGIIKAAPKP